MSETSHAAEHGGHDLRLARLVGPSTAMAKAAIAIGEMSGLDPQELFSAAIAALSGVAAHCARPGRIGDLLLAGSVALHANAEDHLPAGRTVR